MSSQSASAARELFITLGTTISVTFIRLYFTLVILSFAKALLKQNRMEARYNDVQNGTSSRSLEQEEEDEVANATGYFGEFRKAIFDLEVRSKEYLDDLFN